MNEEDLLKEEAPPLPDPVPEPEAEQDTAPEADTAPPEVPLEERLSAVRRGVPFSHAIQSRSDQRIRVIGYARRAQPFAVSERISTDGCRNGWYEIAPPAGFSPAPIRGSS